MGFVNLVENDRQRITLYIANIIVQRPNFFNDTSHVLRNALNNVALPEVIYSQDGQSLAMARRSADASLEYFTEFISDRAVKIISGYSQARKAAILAANELDARGNARTRENGYTLTAKNLGDNFLVYELKLLNIALLLSQNQSIEIGGEGGGKVAEGYIQKLKSAIIDDTQGVLYLRGEGAVKSARGIMMANPDGSKAGKIFNEKVAKNENVKAVLAEVERFLTINSHILTHPSCTELADSIRAFLKYFKPIEGPAAGQYSKRKKK